MNLRVKICGITRLADAELAAELGADALGFVFFEKSPRNITFADAAKIIEKLPTHIRKIGVFVNPKYAFAAEAVRIAGLDAIQLHGIYGDANFLKINDLPTMLAIAVDENGLDKRSAKLLPEADAVLLDAHHPTQHGDTGRTFNWQFAAAHSRQQPIILAGGLNPANIRSAVETVRPFAVDVSSGVEASPGVKDATKLKQFFKKIEAFRNDRHEEIREFFPISR